eukprot:jgi/Psemu1/303798/fgenesh1_kg.123_\
MASHSLSATLACGRRTVASLSRGPIAASSCSTTTLAEGSPHTDHQRRSFWMDVVRIKPQKQRRGSKDDNKKNKFQMVHEDPEQVVRRHTDEVRADGENLLELMFFNDRHEKAWMKRKRLQNLRRYEFDKKHVNDLAKYIAFVQDYGEDDNSSSGEKKAPPKKK